MHDPTTDAGYTTAGDSPTAKTIGQFLALEGESIYEGLGRTARLRKRLEPAERKR
jgi:hypothetical protein